MKTRCAAEGWTHELVATTNYSHPVDKLTRPPTNGTVIYRSRTRPAAALGRQGRRRMHAKTKRNFEIFSAEEFIAAITQHIPDKGFQMVRYYGW